jgi:hypothetical protein
VAPGKECGLTHASGAVDAGVSMACCRSHRGQEAEDDVDADSSIRDAFDSARRELMDARGHAARSRRTPVFSTDG